MWFSFSVFQTKGAAVTSCLIQIMFLDKLQKLDQHPTLAMFGPFESNVSSVLENSLGNLYV